jgi:hypothetical protein
MIPPSHRLGNGLMGFGAVGLGLSVALAIALLVGLASLGDVGERLESNRLAMASALRDGDRLLAGTAATMASTTASLDSVQASLEDTAQLLGRVEGSTRELVSALRISILGQRPFAGVATSFEEIGDQLARSADDAAIVAHEVESLQPNLAGVTGDLRSLQASVSVLAEETSAFRDLEGMITITRLLALLWALVSVWLAALAAGCIWLGRRLRRGAEIVLTP